MALFPGQQPVLKVDLIGVGTMRVVGPGGVKQDHLLYVLAVQQQAAAWTVYRRLATFSILAQHLSAAVPGLPPCPPHDPAAIRHPGPEAEALRLALLAWMQQLMAHPAVPQAPVMRNFLWAEANLPPPGLDITWVRHSADSGGGGGRGGDHGGSEEFDDEMDMDDLFDRHLDDRERDSYDDDALSPADSAAGGGGGGRRGSRGGGGGGYGGGGGGGSSRSNYSGGGFYGASPGMGSSVGSWQPPPSGVAHSFTQRHGLQGDDFDGDGLDDDSDFDETDRDQAEPLDAAFGDNDHHPHHHHQGSSSSSHASSSSSSGSSSVGSSQPSSHGSAAAVTASAPVAAPGAASSGGGRALDAFKVLRVIGKGSFGKVFLVREKVSNQIYAMKVLRKDNIVRRNQVEHTRTERSVLGYVRHPFIVGLKCAFQTPDKLFFVLDYCAGGELFFHLGKLGKFPEVRARFYAAEIALALGYVHQLDIIYRDLKPENVLLDDRGHVRLTDFGLSKEGISNNTSGAHSFCGTPEYLAPEILNRQGHGRAVDWWSLGALLYEMLTGLPPFYCRDREKLFEKIRSAELTYPKYLTRQAVGLLKGLLTRDPAQRLGSGPTDAQEIRQHPFFVDIDWTALANGELSPPWEPTVTGSLDTSQFDHEFTSMPIHSPAAAPNGFLSDAGTFAGFSYSEKSGLAGMGSL